MPFDFANAQYTPFTEDESKKPATGGFDFANAQFTPPNTDNSDAGVADVAISAVKSGTYGAVDAFAALPDIAANAYDYLNTFNPLMNDADKEAYSAKKVTDFLSGAPAIHAKLKSLADEEAKTQGAKILSTATQKADKGLESFIATGNAAKLGDAPSDPALWVGSAAQAIPSLLAMWMTGGGLPVAMLLEGGSQSNAISDYEKKTGKKVSTKDRASATLIAGTIGGISEKFSFDKVFKAAKGSSSRAANALIAGTTEGLTEGVQQLNSNLAMRGFIDPTQSPTEGLVTSMIGGHVAGAGIGAIQSPLTAAQEDAPPSTKVDTSQTNANIEAGQDTTGDIANFADSLNQGDLSTRLDEATGDTQTTGSITDPLIRSEDDAAAVNEVRGLLGLNAPSTATPVHPDGGAVPLDLQGVTNTNEFVGNQIMGLAQIAQAEQPRTRALNAPTQQHGLNAPVITASRVDENGVITPVTQAEVAASNQQRENDLASGLNEVRSTINGRTDTSLGEVPVTNLPGFKHKLEDITKKGGTPYPTKASATVGLKQKDATDTHNIIRVTGGFIGVPKQETPEVKAEVSVTKNLGGYATKDKTVLSADTAEEAVQMVGNNPDFSAVKHPNDSSKFAARHYTSIKKPVLKPTENLIQMLKDDGGIRSGQAADITGETDANKSGVVGLFKPDGRSYEDLAQQYGERFGVNPDDKASFVTKVQDAISANKDGRQPVLTVKGEQDRIDADIARQEKAQAKQDATDAKLQAQKDKEQADFNAEATTNAPTVNVEASQQGKQAKAPIEDSSLLDTAGRESAKKQTTIEDTHGFKFENDPKLHAENGGYPYVINANDSGIKGKGSRGRFTVNMFGFASYGNEGHGYYDTAQQAMDTVGDDERFTTHYTPKTTHDEGLNGYRAQLKTVSRANRKSKKEAQKKEQSAFDNEFSDFGTEDAKPTEPTHPKQDAVKAKQGNNTSAIEKLMVMASRKARKDTFHKAVLENRELAKEGFTFIYEAPRPLHFAQSDIYAKLGIEVRQVEIGGSKFAILANKPIPAERISKDELIVVDNSARKALNKEISSKMDLARPIMLTNDDGRFALIHTSTKNKDSIQITYYGDDFVANTDEQIKTSDFKDGEVDNLFRHGYNHVADKDTASHAMKLSAEAQVKSDAARQAMMDGFKEDKKARDAKRKSESHPKQAAVKAKQKEATPKQDALKSEMDDALADLNEAMLGMISLKAVPGGKGAADVIPLLTKVMNIAFRMGYTKFKDNARFVLDTIRGKFGDKIADAVKLNHLQGAYIGMGNGSDSFAEVGKVTSLDGLTRVDKASEPAHDEKAGVTNGHDERSGKSLERDSKDTTSENEVGKKGVHDGRGSDSGSGEHGVSTADKTRAGRSGERVLGHETIADREDSDFSPYSEPPRTITSIARDNERERSGEVGHDGSPVEPQKSGTLKSSIKQTRDVNQRKKAQAEAEQTEVTPNNIAETLPLLFEGQQKDVKFAEERLAKVGGYGVMFTNGTGTGKTASGMGIIKRLHKQGKRNILIVVPSDKIARDWVSFGKMMHVDISMLADTKDKGQGVTITTYANFGQNNEIVHRKWDAIVTDESHYLMQAADGKETLSLNKLRAITLHPKGAYTRAASQYADLLSRMATLKFDIELARKS
ncbi:MAG: DEAD/DEAH box helicase family protein, partial [Ghiorsea sp.]